jgi:CheY-like chemotaxis protein
MPIDIERGLKAGFVHYLTKPVKVDELLRAVSEISAPR